MKEEFTCIINNVKNIQNTVTVKICVVFNKTVPLSCSLINAAQRLIYEPPVHVVCVCVCVWRGGGRIQRELSNIMTN